MAIDFIAVQQFADVDAFAQLYPPTWTRLEPQSWSGDPRPGIEARIHDPLWLIARQWQLGELEGEDAGTPLTVRVVTSTVPVDRWAPGETGGDPQPLGAHALLEPLVEAEPPVPPLREGPAGPGVRARAEAGAALLGALEDDAPAGLAAYRQALFDECSLDLEPLHHPGGEAAGADPVWARLERLFGGRPLVDGERACWALEDAGGALPPWIVLEDPADGPVVLDAWTRWAEWYRAEVSPIAAHDDAWVGDRLEHRFRVAAGDTVLVAPAHGGGEIGWHSFDAVPDGVLGEPPPGGSARQLHALLATPLRYAGMPADRLWEMEDAEVNVGLLEAEPWDLARLLVAEFALTYGNDWLTVPVDVPFGSLVEIESVMYVTTFGERFRVRPTAEVSPDGRWRMFGLTTREGASIDGMLIPPGAVAVQDGPAIEEVLFLRDDAANMAWAVERSVVGPSGTARDRSRERDGLPAAPARMVDEADLDYQLQTSLPARWIPYLPKPTGYRAIKLVQGRIPAADRSLPAPKGRLLNRPDSSEILDAEIPREGVTVRRQPSVTRRADGTYLRWTTRRVSVGRGEGASQLAFDWARPRKPSPNQP